jgi:hypothetical protein
VVPSIDDPVPEKEPNDITVEDNVAIKDVPADGDRLDASFQEEDTDSKIDPFARI